MFGCSVSVSRSSSPSQRRHRRRRVGVRRAPPRCVHRARVRHVIRLICSGYRGLAFCRIRGHTVKQLYRELMKIVISN